MSSLIFVPLSSLVFVPLSSLVFVPLSSLVCVTIIPDRQATHVPHLISPVNLLLSLLLFQLIQFKGPYVAYCEAHAQSESRKTNGTNTGAGATYATGALS